jgi:hypothetical protein
MKRRRSGGDMHRLRTNSYDSNMVSRALEIEVEFASGEWERTGDKS